MIAADLACSYNNIICTLNPLVKYEYDNIYDITILYVQCIHW